MRGYNLIRATKYIGIIGVITIGFVPLALAQKTDISVDLMPIQYAAVKGDVNKFQEMTGIKADSAAGINNLTIDGKPAKDVHISFEGHIVPNENDNDGTILITKDNVGYVKVGYKSLRKYYDGTGGYSQLINNHTATPTSYGIGQDLRKDIGWFNLEIGNGTPDDSNIWFSYERMTKTGDEDSLSWSSVYESATSGMTKPYKKLAPSLLTTDEHTDTLSLNEKADMPARFTLKGKQSYEFMDGINSRTETQYTYPGDPTPNSDGKIRQVIDQNQTKLMTTSIRAERWSLNDETFFATGYLFAHTRNSQIETIAEFSPTGIPTGFSNPKNTQGYALNVEDKNTVTGELVTNLFPSLTFISKFKAELIGRTSSSDNYIDPYSAGATSGAVTAHVFTPTYDLQGNVENKTTRTGETVALRFSGIPRTSLFADVDLQQERNWISEQQYQTNTHATNISYEGINNTPSYVTTIGARLAPIKNVTLTTDFKHKDNDRKYNTIYNLTPTSEYFFNKLQTITDELNEKINWKIFKWLQNSFAYKLANNDYHTQLIGQDWEKSQGNESDLNYDITIEPNDAWMFNFGYSLQLLKASSPASSQNSTTNIGNIYVPPFTGNVYSLMCTTSYSPKENLSFFHSLEYSRAPNGNNNNSVVGGILPYVVNDEWWNMTVGLKWGVTKNITVEPHYAYYSFRSYQSVEVGNYSAHVLFLDLNAKW